jgi:predicted ATPase
MPLVVFTGGPGAGKTTVLDELARMGYATMPDAARAVIAERRRRGDTPRPEPAPFAREVLARDLAAYAAGVQAGGWSFHDRGVVDAAGLALEGGALTPAEAAAVVERHPYHRPVFVFPPWPAIYARDDERDQTWDEAVAVHGRVVRWYAACGYALHEVPCADPATRARHVLHTLGLRVPR